MDAGHKLSERDICTKFIVPALKDATRAYLRAVEKLSGCKLALVATGADRKGTIVLDDPFA
jgi:adenylosuccinate synthase